MVVAQANTSNKAISLQDNTGGNNTVTKNTINEANAESPPAAQHLVIFIFRTQW
jgi:hypothetical protein